MAGSSKKVEAASGPSRRQFIAGCGALIGGSLLPANEPLISQEDLGFLRGMATATIASATKNDSIARLGFPVVTPGGDYPALWVRDFSMAAGCGLIPPETIRRHLFVIANAQNGPTERKLGSRALIPPFAIPDHIDYDGGAVFYPGTYSSGDDQGGEPWGVLPPADDHYEFVHLAYLLWAKTRDSRFLRERVQGLTLFERLHRALDCPTTDRESGLFTTGTENRAVGFGFCDGIYFTGSVLFPSLLRYRALGEMIQLSHAHGDRRHVSEWSGERAKISHHLTSTFLNDGWLIAATEVGRQPDVWGSIYALYLNILKGRERDLVRGTLREAVLRGTVTYQGAVRHVPTDHNFSATSAWEKTAGETLNRYQNGAYWHVPSGWLARAVWELDKPLARKIVREMVGHFRSEDGRLSKGHGAPWECIHPDGDYRQNPIYMASVTLPLEALTS